MKVSHLAILIAVCMSSNAYSAEIGEVLRGLNQFKNVIEQNVVGLGSRSLPMLNPKNPNNLTRFAVLNAEEYCAALQNNELIKKYVEAVAAANKAGAFDAMTGTYL